MNILFITRKYPPAIGGMEKLSHHLTTEISKNAKSYTIALRRSQKWLPVFFIYAFFKAARICNTKKINVIHIGDPVLSLIGVLLKKMFNLPVAVTCHGLDLTYKNPFYQKYLDVFFPKLDLYICISRHVQQIACKRAAKERTAVVPVGISGDFKYSQKSNSKTLITVGRLVPRKGVAWFIENVFAKLPDAYSYIIAGNGPEYGKITQLIRQNRLEKRATLATNANDEKIKELYNKSGIFVMPNISVPNDAEGFGIVALEASASGLPVIASNIEGIPDAIIDGKNGYLVQERDADAFAKKITGMTSVGKKFSEYTLKKYSWQKIAQQYVKLFQRLL